MRMEFSPQACQEFQTDLNSWLQQLSEARQQFAARLEELLLQTQYEPLKNHTVEFLRGMGQIPVEEGDTPMTRFLSDVDGRDGVLDACRQWSKTVLELLREEFGQFPLEQLEMLPTAEFDVSDDSYDGVNEQFQSYAEEIRSLAAGYQTAWSGETNLFLQIAADYVSKTYLQMAVTAADNAAKRMNQCRKEFVEKLAFATQTAKATTESAAQSTKGGTANIGTSAGRARQTAANPAGSAKSGAGAGNVSAAESNWNNVSEKSTGNTAPAGNHQNTLPHKISTQEKNLGNAAAAESYEEIPYDDDKVIELTEPPAVEEPPVNQPAAEESDDDKVIELTEPPVVEEPPVNQPAPEESDDDKAIELEEPPAVEEPPVNQPAAGEPPRNLSAANRSPANQRPVTQPSAGGPPKNQSAANHSPVNQRPVTQPSAGEPPRSQSAANHSPVNQRPVTQPSAGGPPRSQSAANHSPVNQRPVNRPVSGQHGSIQSAGSTNIEAQNASLRAYLARCCKTVFDELEKEYALQEKRRQSLDKIFLVASTASAFAGLGILPLPLLSITNTAYNALWASISISGLMDKRKPIQQQLYKLKRSAGRQLQDASPFRFPRSIYTVHVADTLETERTEAIPADACFPPLVESIMAIKQQTTCHVTPNVQHRMEACFIASYRFLNMTAAPAQRNRLGVVSACRRKFWPRASEDEQIFWSIFLSLSKIALEVFPPDSQNADVTNVAHNCFEQYMQKWFSAQFYGRLNSKYHPLIFLEIRPFAESLSKIHNKFYLKEQFYKYM